MIGRFFQRSLKVVTAWAGAFALFHHNSGACVAVSLTNAIEPSAARANVETLPLIASIGWVCLLSLALTISIEAWNPRATTAAIVRSSIHLGWLIGRSSVTPVRFFGAPPVDGCRHRSCASGPSTRAQVYAIVVPLGDTASAPMGPRCAPIGVKLPSFRLTEKIASLN